ncbi:hypothetical protein [Pseudoxanthomonas mexicana]
MSTSEPNTPGHSPANRETDENELSQVLYTDYALERLRVLDLQPWVCAEIKWINAHELQAVTANGPIEGYVQNKETVWWRRAVRRADIASYLDYESYSEDDPSDAQNYVSVYRWATADERIEHKITQREALLVVSVVSNIELLRYLL